MNYADLKWSIIQEWNSDAKYTNEHLIEIGVEAGIEIKNVRADRKSIIAKLHVYKYYGEMTIDEVKTLITYSDIDHHKWDGYDWKWGEKLFKEI